ncbi:MAG: ATP-binding protein [Deltaproteobacteria bacterium]|jgi:hypothetical protein|nr:ATP-binding protein [Deltaproteobacteria bacterium]
MEQKTIRLGDPSFREIRHGNYIYADKTQYIHKMLKISKCCFLSRPRRFGKTLLLDTIDSLFQGERTLFDGLWIDKNGYQFEKHPVLNFNMAYDEISTKDDLIARIKRNLRKHARQEGIQLTPDDSIREMFDDLLQGIYEKFGVGAVILVDEYDAPVTRHISDLALALANRDVLHDFYQSMKANIKHIHFAFVTGITRFAMTSLDSGPNNFTDISLMSKFSGICGFTIKEFNKLFKNRFTKTLKILKKAEDIEQNADVAKLKATILDWYDGYNWLGPQHVLNPYSILNFFTENRLRTYWPLTGKSLYISQLAQERPLDFMSPKLESYLSQEIRISDLENIEPASILFHSGYLTIDRRIHVQNEEAFILRTPNREVKLHYKSYIFMQIFNKTLSNFQNFARDITVAILEKKSKQISDKLHDLLSGITFRQHLASEQHYHSLFHAAFAAAGIEVMSETAGSKGQADMAMFLDSKIRVVLELKYRKGSDTGGGNENEHAAKSLVATLDEAEKSIRDKDYAGPFRMAAKEIICMALAVYHRDQVAVRFVDSHVSKNPPDS